LQVTMFGDKRRAGKKDIPHAVRMARTVEERRKRQQRGWEEGKALLPRTKETSKNGGAKTAGVPRYWWTVGGKVNAIPKGK